MLINEHFLDLFYVLAVSLASGMSVEEKRNLKHELKSLKMEDTFFIHGISGTRKEIGTKNLLIQTSYGPYSIGCA